MKEQSIKNLTVTALGLQAAALVLTILMTIGQQSIKLIFSADDKITEIFSIPLEALIKIIPVLILYIAGVVNPFIWAAFAVFCIACGGCFGVKTKEADNQSAYGVYGYNENFKME